MFGAPAALTAAVVALLATTTSGLRLPLPTQAPAGATGGVAGAAQALDRRAWVQQGAAAALASVAALGGVGGAQADFYEKGDELQGNIFANERAAKIRENYPGVRDAVEAIKSLDLLASDKDYTGIRGTLRRPPAVNLRISSRNVISYLDADAKGAADKAYSSFITSLEKVDRLASLGAKGSDVQADLFKEIERCSKLGVDFLALLPKPE